jgi:CelD/BcsL family acetyltransferase involved in cellulose biosynthesis
MRNEEMRSANAIAQAVEARVVEGFEALMPLMWMRLLAAGDTNEVFLTPEWQNAWWQTFGRGRLLLIVAERHGEPVAIAPLFADSGMVFFVGSGGSDYLDFVGDIGEPEVLDAILLTAQRCVRDFVGFRFYLVPDQSRTGELLQRAAARLQLRCYDEGELAAPLLSFREIKESPADKKSLRRHERALRRDGRLTIEHTSDIETIIGHLDEFFQQHIERWQTTGSPSLFLDEQQKDFYRRTAQAGSEAGWLRFTRVLWNERPVAFHFGFSYRGKFLWYKPTFAIDLAKRSPGEVLLRNLLLAATAENCDRFDFGLGDEAFKRRFANQMNYVRTWGLYPESSHGGSA